MCADRRVRTLCRVCKVLCFQVRCVEPTPRRPLPATSCATGTQYSLKCTRLEPVVVVPIKTVYCNVGAVLLVHRPLLLTLRESKRCSTTSTAQAAPTRASPLRPSLAPHASPHTTPLHHTSATPVCDTCALRLLTSCIHTPHHRDPPEPVGHARGHRCAPRRPVRVVPGAQAPGSAQFPSGPSRSILATKP